MSLERFQFGSFPKMEIHFPEMYWKYFTSVRPLRLGLHYFFPHFSHAAGGFSVAACNRVIAPSGKMKCALGREVGKDSRRCHGQMRIMRSAWTPEATFTSPALLAASLHIHHRGGAGGGVPCVFLPHLETDAARTVNYPAALSLLLDKMNLLLVLLSRPAPKRCVQ